MQPATQTKHRETGIKTKASMTHQLNPSMFCVSSHLMVELYAVVTVTVALKSDDEAKVMKEEPRQTSMVNF